jgi:predicted DNA binding CopG/RHH family protein
MIMNVRCVNNDGLHQPEGSSEWINVPNSGDLTIGKSYEVITVENAFYRIIDDSGEDYLYPAAMFEIIPAEEQVNIRIGRSIFEKISKIAKKEHLSVEELASQMLEKQLS